jgi:hypothetical protein
LLGLGVWLVYAADRWIEGWRLTPDIVQTPRHLFYMRYRWLVFVVAMVASVVIAVVAVDHLGNAELKASFILLIPTTLYLFSHQLLHRHHPLRLPKEMCIGIIFALGCAFASAVHAPDRFRMLYVPVLLFGLLCFANCALISVWEMEVDARHGQTSLALQFKGVTGLIRLLPWLIAIAGVAVFLLGASTVRSAAICTVLSGALMGMIDLIQPSIGRMVARVTVDLALMTPALFMLFR